MEPTLSADQEHGRVIRGRADSSSTTNPPDTNSGQLPWWNPMLSSRYKTELCNHFQESGVCKYGKGCLFAHGQSEIRQMKRHPKYKTEICRDYHKSGICSFGQRCNFIHSDTDMKAMLKLLRNELIASSLIPNNFQSPQHAAILGFSPHSLPMHLYRCTPSTNESQLPSTNTFPFSVSPHFLPMNDPQSSYECGSQSSSMDGTQSSFPLSVPPHLLSMNDPQSSSECGSQSSFPLSASHFLSMDHSLSSSACGSPSSSMSGSQPSFPLSASHFLSMNHSQSSSACGSPSASMSGSQPSFPLSASHFLSMNHSQSSSACGSQSSSMGGSQSSFPLSASPHSSSVNRLWHISSTDGSQCSSPELPFHTREPPSGPDLTTDWIFPRICGSNQQSYFRQAADGD